MAPPRSKKRSSTASKTKPKKAQKKRKENVEQRIDRLNKAIKNRRPLPTLRASDASSDSSLDDSQRRATRQQRCVGRSTTPAQEFTTTTASTLHTTTAASTLLLLQQPQQETPRHRDSSLAMESPAVVTSVKTKSAPPRPTEDAAADLEKRARLSLGSFPVRVRICLQPVREHTGPRSLKFDPTCQWLDWPSGKGMLGLTSSCTKEELVHAVAARLGQEPMDLSIASVSGNSLFCRKKKQSESADPPNKGGCNGVTPLSGANDYLEALSKISFAQLEDAETDDDESVETTESGIHEAQRVVYYLDILVPYWKLKKTAVAGRVTAAATGGTASSASVAENATTLVVELLGPVTSHPHGACEVPTLAVLSSFNISPPEDGTSRLSLGGVRAKLTNFALNAAAYKQKDGTCLLGEKSKLFFLENKSRKNVTHVDSTQLLWKLVSQCRKKKTDSTVTIRLAFGLIKETDKPVSRVLDTNSPSHANFSQSLIELDSPPAYTRNSSKDTRAASQSVTKLAADFVWNLVTKSEASQWHHSFTHEMQSIANTFFSHKAFPGGMKAWHVWLLEEDIVSWPTPTDMPPWEQYSAILNSLHPTKGKWAPLEPGVDGSRKLPSGKSPTTTPQPTLSVAEAISNSSAIFSTALATIASGPTGGVGQAMAVAITRDFRFLRRKPESTLGTDEDPIPANSDAAANISSNYFFVDFPANALGEEAQNGDALMQLAQDLDEADWKGVFQFSEDTAAKIHSGELVLDFRVLESGSVYSESTFCAMSLSSILATSTKQRVDLELHLRVPAPVTTTARVRLGSKRT
jgi:hypothetical protein